MIVKKRWRLSQFFELIWWRHFLYKKNQEAYFSQKKEYWHFFLSHISDVWSSKAQDSQTILDAGCGPSGIFMILNSHHVDAIDPLVQAYEKKLPHFSPEMYPYVNFTKKQIESINTSKKYDTVFCLNAINHVADIKTCLVNLSKAMKDNGQMIISCDTHNYRMLKFLFKMIPADILHPHQMSVNDLEILLRKCALQIQKRTCLKSRKIFNYHVWVVVKRNL